MTTATPLFCHAGLFRPHAMGGTLPLSGHWSIGLLRAKRRLLAGVLHRINFTAAYVYVLALARPRRSGPSNLCWRRTAESSTSGDSISPDGANQRSETQAPGSLCANRVVHIAGEPNTALAPGVEAQVYQQWLSEYW